MVLYGQTKTNVSSTIPSYAGPCGRRRAPRRTTPEIAGDAIVRIEDVRDVLLLSFVSCCCLTYSASKLNSWRSEAGLATYGAPETLLNMLITLVLYYVAYGIGFGAAQLFRDRARP